MSRISKAIRKFRGNADAADGLRVFPTPADQPTSADAVAHGRRAAFRRALSRFEPPYKLHMACGTVYLNGWVNLDVDAANHKLDAEWDLREPLPLDAGTVRFIYHEHFFEHLAVEEGLALLRECRRLLTPGGVLRISMPDLTECVRQYYENDWRQPWMKKYGYEFIQTRAEMINIAFRDWGHMWLYDREELHRRLREAGFAKLRDCARLESPAPELRGLETRDETLLVVEATA